MEKVDWGEIEYAEALERQLMLVEEVASGLSDRIIFCSHPPVVTLGRATQPEDLRGWNGDVVSTTRGGRATYHGPGQLIIYPIMNLDRLGCRDVHYFLRTLEWVVRSVLEEFSVECELDPVLEEGLLPTGVWIRKKKVASIGIAIRKWVTYHGVALNLYDERGAFEGIQPCGLSEGLVSSLEKLTGKRWSRELAMDKSFQYFQQAFLQ